MKLYSVSDEAGKPDIHQELEEFQLILQGHGIDQGLIAVPQVHAAPGGGLFYGVFLHPVIGHLRGHMVSFAVFLADCRFFHVLRSFLFCAFKAP